MKKIVIATDSFKGSLSGEEAANAVANGVRSVFDKAEIICLSVSDGGEGLTKSLIAAVGGKTVAVKTSDPLGRKITAEYGVIKGAGGGETAVIEVAAASGLTLLAENERNPEKASSRGTGELICAAIKAGYRDFLIGLGGSATNDCGTGMLSALGFGFFDGNNNEVSGGAEGLDKIERISGDNVLKELAFCSFTIACDVKNPLCGKNGCSYVFSGQKGGTAQTMQKEDEAMARFARLVKTVYPSANENAEGAGAAGGLGFAFSAFLNANMAPGSQTFLNYCGFGEKLKNADLAITGEGRLDGQSAMGKIPVGVAAEAVKAGVPTIALVGSIGEGAEKCNECGIIGYFPIIDKPCSIETALDHKTAEKNLERTAAQLMRVIKTFGLKTKKNQ